MILFIRLKHKKNTFIYIKKGVLTVDKIVIKGGKPLKGTISIGGAKNAAVAIIPACLLIDGICRLENLPNIQDVKLYLKILSHLGADVRHINDSTVDIDCSTVNSFEPSSELTSKMRGSSYLMGALLGRFNKCISCSPGGCDFGLRPIDQHVKSFEALGATVALTYGKINITAEKLTGNQIYFDFVTVGATVNAMLAATLAEGTTIIENAAREPHIVDLANFLNAMGARIRGAGTGTIKITGVKSLHGGSYSIIPDQIEAGTYMIAAAATRGDVTITNVTPRHLEPISNKLEEIGAKIEEFDDSVRVYVPENTKFKKINFTALPYPGFPTDMQPQLVAFLSIIHGISHARDNVWDQRFRYVGELSRMGANITVESNHAIITGVDKLMGASVCATDLRAGAAMIIAGLVADGTTEITDIHHIERGYENFEDKLSAVGADIHRVQVMSDY